MSRGGTRFGSNGVARHCGASLILGKISVAQSQYTSEQFQRLMADQGVVCSMSRSGNVWDNAAMESFFSSLKTERTVRKTYRTRNEARADVFDYIECFYNVKRRHSTIGYMSPMEFELKAGFA
jgi:putative transposase